MPGLHLNHFVSWDDLLELCYVYEDPGIKLPICECGRIQASEKKVQHQIKNRKYLDDKICTSPDCKIVGEKLFRKNDEKRCVGFPKYWNSRDCKDIPKVVHFVDDFQKAIKKLLKLNEKRSKIEIFLKEILKNIVKMLKKNLKKKWPLTSDAMKTLRCDECERWTCSCKLFSVLLETGCSKTLLSMPDEKIRGILEHLHDEQAGNYLLFLAYHAIGVYVSTNLIIAADLQDQPDQWGPMAPNDRFRQFLMEDCDGQTFLFGCRKYLTDEVYMKDFDAMKELCRKCFRFLYLLEMLSNEAGHNYGVIHNFFSAS